MFDFSELLVFLKSIFEALSAFVKKLGLDIGKDTETDPASEG